MDCQENGIIFGIAMAEKKLENSKVRYLAAYPTGAKRMLRRETKTTVALYPFCSFATFGISPLSPIISLI